MKIDPTKIKETIKKIKATVLPQERYYWMHPTTYFELKNPELVREAKNLNKSHGKSIYDKRTKGWKHIKEAYNKI